LKGSLQNSYKFPFENLEVWHKSMSLAKSVYEFTKTFPKSELYGLSSQLQRAVVSIPSNIAEGSVRFSAKEQIRFYEVSYGSLMETLSQLILAENLNYINKEQLEEIRQEIGSTSRMLNALTKSISERSEL